MSTMPRVVHHARRLAVAGVATVAALSLAGLSLSTLVEAAETGAHLTGVAATATATLPSSSIKGTTAHWVPTSLSATAVDTGTTCTEALASFVMANHTKAAQTITLTATKISGSDKFTLPKGKGEYICITKGYTGVAHAALSDGKKLKITF
jgi:hypothetical protein